MDDYLAPEAWHFVVDVLRLAVWLALLMAVFVPLERVLALRPAKVWRSQMGVDLGWYFINSLVPAAIMALPLALLARSLQGANPLGLYSTLAAWPLGLKLLVLFFVNDVGSYWGHRALHTYAPLWRFHAIHHSSEHVDWLVNTRAHPLDMVMVRMAGMVPVYLLGLAQANQGHLDPMAAIVTIVGTIWSFFIHANLRIRLGPLEWVVSTPFFHHWHHTNDAHRDRNFAAIFPVIDKLFGTAWRPGHWPPVYGIDAHVGPSLSDQLLDPLRPRQPA
jgi:sterol desaturase/sphingolipid hydroxylase (fatty acid hydroxylase superfamily)